LADNSDYCILIRVVALTTRTE